MGRTLTHAEVAKRAAIHASKTRNPAITTRELAKVHQTSLRVVAEALRVDLKQWGTLLDATPDTRFPLVLSPAMPPEPLVPRDYQASAAKASVARNTLLVLPTGLGKTIVALLHVKAILSSVVAGICIMMAPTKALLVQHRDLFAKHLGVSGAGLAIVDGETTPDNRRAFYRGLEGRRVVLFMTPQTVLHDLEKGRLPRESVVDLVVDESHHATRGDPYALVHAYLREHHVHPRVLAMTASPGETEARIVDVCQNLGINPADAIMKSRDDPDVAPHVFKLDVQRYAVDLTPEYERVRGLLVAVLREPCVWLRSAGLAGATAEVGADSLALPSWESLQALADTHLGGASARAIGEGDETVRVRGDVVSQLVLALRARHCVELVETQGFPALLAYHDKLAGKVAESASESLLALMGHPQYKAAVAMAGKLVAEGSPKASHPKLDALARIIGDFVHARPRSRCIVFTKYRASIPMIVARLTGLDAVVARRFVGQGDASAADKGMNRDEQQAVLRDFKAGAFNVLVATKAAEEGIDVADCDMVAFYEATASVIQFIQRQGRAGRRRDGDVAILLANGTADQLHAALLDTKLGAMPGIYYRVQRIRLPGTPEPRLQAISRVSRVPSRPVTASRPKPPILVDTSFMWAGEVERGLTAAGIEARLDEAIGADLLLPGGIGVRVINENDAEEWSVDLTMEEMPSVARRVVAACSGHAARLAAMLAPAGIEVWSCDRWQDLVELVSSAI